MFPDQGERRTRRSKEFHAAYQNSISQIGLEVRR